MWFWWYDFGGVLTFVFLFFLHHVVFIIFDLAFEFYILITGTVKVHRHDPELGEFALENQVCTLGPFDCFGELCCVFFSSFFLSFFFWLGFCASTNVVDLIYFAGESALLDENGTRTASCTSLSDVEMLVLSRDDFMALSKHDQVSDMLVRAAELQRRSYGVKNDDIYGQIWHLRGHTIIYMDSPHYFHPDASHQIHFSCRLRHRQNPWCEKWWYITPPRAYDNLYGFPALFSSGCVPSNPLVVSFSPPPQLGARNMVNSGDRGAKYGEFHHQSSGCGKDIRRSECATPVTAARHKILPRVTLGKKVKNW